VHKLKKKKRILPSIVSEKEKKNISRLQFWYFKIAEV